jgi:hypothetical protein
MASDKIVSYLILKMQQRYDELRVDNARLKKENERLMKVVVDLRADNNWMSIELGRHL